MTDEATSVDIEQILARAIHGDESPKKGWLALHPGTQNILVNKARKTVATLELNGYEIKKKRAKRK